MKYDVTIQTVAWFNARRNDGSLEITPKFQRRAVWLEKERSALLSTICSNLPFPEVYIQVVTDPENGGQKYIVVDGQQRITSILKFIDAEVVLPSGEQWDGKGFAALDVEQKTEFWDYKIVVRMLYNVSDADIRDLFARLNTNNIVLNDQELRNARYLGKFKSTAERLADNPFFQSISLFSAREVRRMEDIEFVSELLLLIVEGVTNKKDLLDTVYLRYEEDFPQEAEHELEFNSVIQMINAITDETNAALIKTKSNFYTVFGACLRHYRLSKRSYLVNVQAVRGELTRVLLGAKTFDAQAADNDPMIIDYYNAVSRAASDKSRRVQREDILFSVIQNAELGAALLVNDGGKKE
jgi:uncharacterized protein with ParB-like and HNH nuclease domain